MSFELQSVERMCEMWRVIQNCYISIVLTF